MEKRWIWPFELEEQIGSGAMGVVYRARFVKNDRRVALKLLPAEVALSSTLAARFQREMEILKDLRHPHIVHCFGGTCEGDQWFYAMELIDGGSLQMLLSEQGKLHWRRAVEFGIQAAAALDHAHKQGVIHRDFKPGNLLLTKSGKVKLADFGLALVASENRLTSAGKTLGSIHYMSPEQIQGKPPISNRSDLYALGCVLFEFLCGKPPFTGDSTAEILQQHLKKPAPRVSSRIFDCPPALDALVADLLQKSPANRPESAAIVQQRLKQIDTDISVRAPRGEVRTPTDDTMLNSAPTIEAGSLPRSWNLRLVICLTVALIVCGWSWKKWGDASESNKRSARFLIDTMQSSQQPIEVRQFAAGALGEMHSAGDEVVESLVKAFSDGDPRIRSAAAKALEKLGRRDAYLLAALKKQREQDEDGMVRDAVEHAIWQIEHHGVSASYGIYIGLGAMIFASATGYWLWRQVKKHSAPPAIGAAR